MKPMDNRVHLWFLHISVCVWGRERTTWICFVQHLRNLLKALWSHELVYIQCFDLLPTLWVYSGLPPSITATWEWDKQDVLQSGCRQTLSSSCIWARDLRACLMPYPGAMNPGCEQKCRGGKNRWWVNPKLKWSPSCVTAERWAQKYVNESRSFYPFNDMTSILNYSALQFCFLYSIPSTAFLMP